MVFVELSFLYKTYYLIYLHHTGVLGFATWLFLLTDEKKTAFWDWLRISTITSSFASEVQNVFIKIISTKSTTKSLSWEKAFSEHFAFFAWLLVESSTKKIFLESCASPTNQFYHMLQNNRNYLSYCKSAHFVENLTNLSIKIYFLRQSIRKKMQNRERTIQSRTPVTCYENKREDIKIIICNVNMIYWDNLLNNNVRIFFTYFLFSA